MLSVAGGPLPRPSGVPQSSRGSPPSYLCQSKTNLAAHLRALPLAGSPGHGGCAATLRFDPPSGSLWDRRWCSSSSLPPSLPSHQSLPSSLPPIHPMAASTGFHACLLPDTSALCSAAAPSPLRGGVTPFKSFIWRMSWRPAGVCPALHGPVLGGLLHHQDFRRCRRTPGPDPKVDWGPRDKTAIDGRPTAILWVGWRRAMNCYQLMDGGRW